MEDKPCTSTKADQQTSMPEVYNQQLWTKSLKDMPNFTHEHIEKYLILEKDKTPDKKPAEALKHKKAGYRLFKAGYATKIWVKANIRKADNIPHFIVRCQVNAEMRKLEYTVYVHLNQVNGDIAYAKCQCPAGAGGRCKHVAAILFQLLDFSELDLTEVPDDKTCTEELQQWHVPKKLQNKGAILFEDLIFPQDSYEKDKKGRKRPAVQGKREEYFSSNEKVSKSDLENLKSGLEQAGANCPLVGLIADNECNPSSYNENELPSRKKLLEIKQSKSNLESTHVRDSVVSKLTETTDYTYVPNEQCKAFVQSKPSTNHTTCSDIEKNTRAQSKSTEWFEQRKCRVTASLFGQVIKEKENNLSTEYSEYNC